MSDGRSPASWRQKVIQAVALLLLVSFGARTAADLLEPLVPMLVAVVVVWAIGWFVIGRRR